MIEYNKQISYFVLMKINKGFCNQKVFLFRILFNRADKYKYQEEVHSAISFNNVSIKLMGTFVSISVCVFM